MGFLEFWVGMNTVLDFEFTFWANFARELIGLELHKKLNDVKYHDEEEKRLSELV